MGGELTTLSWLKLREKFTKQYSPVCVKAKKKYNSRGESKFTSGKKECNPKADL